MASMDSTKALRKALKGKNTDRFAEGDVIRWTSGGRYIYGALKAGGRWWITGGAGFYGSSVKTYDELVEILARADVDNITVSAMWEDVV